MRIYGREKWSGVEINHIIEQKSFARDPGKGREKPAAA
jgi:hypothetical protein